MLDPRDPVDSDEALTEQSDDELLDLQKEFEARRRQLLEKKKAQKAPESTDKPRSTKPPSTAKQTSSFIDSLSHTNPVKKISYENRIFEFNAPEPQLLEVENDKDIFTKEYLRIRHYTNDVISTAVKNIKVLNINRLLAKVVKPAYLEPSYENWAFVGYVVHKSKPLVTKNKDKYMTLKVGTFDRAVNVTLFKDAFQRYWKLRLGEAIIVLNPSISRYDKGFGFNLNDDYNSILSIGLIKHIVQCSDPGCETYIHGQLKYCEFHQVKHEKVMLKNSRMELNGSVKLFNPKEKQINEETNSFYHKSEFDERKYFRSNILDTEGKKRKLKDDISNRNLEKKLIKLGNSAKFRSLGLVKADPTETNIEEKTVQKRNDSINELRELSQSKKIHLGASMKDKRIKKARWDKNMEILKKPALKVSEPMFEADNQVTNDDSDIEIEFANESQKHTYNHIVKS